MFDEDLNEFGESEIKQFIDDFLERLSKNHIEMTEGESQRWDVNFGDLHCFDIKYAADKTLSVYIEEVAPDAYDFKIFIEDWLNEVYHRKTFNFNIEIEQFEVITEW